MDATSLSNEQLIDHVRTWAARVARGEAELLDLIGELDAREAWAVHGITSCADWLCWQLGWCDTTARERVRVARALRELPLIRAELGLRRLSYSQVRAVTRIATPDDEPRWLQLARQCTGAQLDKIARGADRARAADTGDGERPVKKPAHVQWDDDGDLILTLRFPAHEAVPVLAVLEQHQAAVQADREAALHALLTVALPGPGAAVASAEADQLALLDPVLDRAGQVALHAAEHPPTDPDASAQAAAPGVPDLLATAVARGHDPLRRYPYVEPAFPIGPDRLGLPLTDTDRAAISAWETERDRLRAIRDAWNTRCEQLLLEASARRLPTGKATLADALVRALTRPVDGPKTTLRLLVDPLSGWARTQHDELLPPATLEALARLLPGRLAPLAQLDRCRHDHGRSTRQVSPALRRLLGQLDGERCRFPGCRHTRFLHAHHLQYWRDGGRTDLANLVLLCTRHHRLLHTTGYQLTLNPDRTLHVHGPDGTPLEHHPMLPAASAEALPPANPNTLPAGYQGDRFDLGYAVNVMLAHAA
jgi:hypothetical protein